MRHWTVGLLLALACGCRGELVPLGDDDDDDDVVTPRADAEPAATLAYKPRIQTDLDTLGCTVSDCHGLSGTPMFVMPSPSDDTMWMANYDEVMPRVGTVDFSLLIAKPTGAGGHLVVVQPTSAVLTRWRDWIEDGAPYE